MTPEQKLAELGLELIDVSNVVRWPDSGVRFECIRAVDLRDEDLESLVAFESLHALGCDLGSVDPLRPKSGNARLFVSGDHERQAIEVRQRLIPILVELLYRDVARREILHQSERTGAYDLAGQIVVLSSASRVDAGSSIHCAGIASDNFEERLQAGEIWEETGLVFTTTIGTPLDARNVVRHFQNTLRRAGMPRIRFHDLRHTAASLLLAQGIEPRVIMETLGHSQISLTMNTYAHVMPTMQRVAADRMDALLSGAEDRA